MRNDNKKSFLMIGSVVLAAVTVIGIAVFLIIGKESPKKTFEEYAALLEEGKYEEMYPYLSKDAKANWAKDDFVKRYSNIFSGIEASNIEINVTDEKDGIVTYEESMQTMAGEISFTHEANLVKEKDDTSSYKIDWNSTYVFPDLADSDYVSVQTEKGKRGTIEDRNGTALATEGTVYSVGMVAGPKATQDTQKKLAEILSIDEDSIKQALDAGWVQEGMFVPVKTISEKDNNAISQELGNLEGVSVQESAGRVYPYGEMLAHVTGYVQNVTAEDLEKNKGKGYTSNSVIGKSGLEAVYEDKLKANDGAVIFIYDQNGNVKKQIAKKEAKNGQNVRTTIDVNTQKAVYEQLKNDAGGSVVMDSKTGEVLALVSTPSYDPQDFALGMDNKTWNALNENKDNPFMNRITSVYTPGSTFKMISAAIGLDSKTIDENTAIEKVEKWQKDKSWGNNYVTTTEQYTEPSNLKNALIYSDNIYFAQLADKIGSKTYTSYLDTFGFNKKINFELGVQQSTYGDKMEDIQKLCATGYGQGDLQISPLHLTSIYTSLINDGTILQPYLVYSNKETKTMVKNAYSKETANIVYKDLQATMNHYGSNPTNAAGKTGTAEIDNGKETIGWVSAVNENIAITMMVDKTKDKGYSQYVLPKVQKILTEVK